MAKTKPAAKKAASIITGKLQRHPMSEMFSLPSSEEERLALGTHMAENGQIQPIIMYEGMVLDGWERYMSSLQKGLTVEKKEYTGPNPAAIAFGANTIRRKLNSVQKALLGAKYFVHTTAEGHKVTQKQVASMSCVSLQRLNALIQLVRAVDTDKEAARCVALLSTDPDVTATMLQKMLVDCGITAASLPVDKPTAGEEHDGDPVGEGDEEHDGATDSSVDMLGGEDIDDLLDDDDAAGDGVGRPRDPKVNSAGGRVGPSTRPHETPASLVSKNFRALTEPERKDFVKFAWAMLRPAVETCIAEGRIEWAAAGLKADAGKSAMADAANAILKAASKPPAPLSMRAKREAAAAEKAAKAAAAVTPIEALKKAEKAAKAKPVKPAAKTAKGAKVVEAKAPAKRGAKKAETAGI